MIAARSDSMSTTRSASGVLISARRARRLEERDEGVAPLSVSLLPGSTPDRGGSRRVRSAGAPSEGVVRRRATRSRRSPFDGSVWFEGVRASVPADAGASIAGRSGASRSTTSSADAGRPAGSFSRSARTSGSIPRGSPRRTSSSNGAGSAVHWRFSSSRGDAERNRNGTPASAS